MRGGGALRALHCLRDKLGPNQGRSEREVRVLAHEGAGQEQVLRPLQEAQVPGVSPGRGHARDKGGETSKKGLTTPPEAPAPRLRGPVSPEPSSRTGPSRRPARAPKAPTG